MQGAWYGFPRAFMDIAEKFQEISSRLLAILPLILQMAYDIISTNDITISNYG